MCQVWTFHHHTLPFVNAAKMSKPDSILDNPLFQKSMQQTTVIPKNAKADEEKYNVSDQETIVELLMELSLLKKELLNEIDEENFTGVVKIRQKMEKIHQNKEQLLRAMQMIALLN